jgi:hypothetical protein
VCVCVCVCVYIYIEYNFKVLRNRDCLLTFSFERIKKKNAQCLFCVLCQFDNALSRAALSFVVRVF